MKALISFIVSNGTFIILGFALVCALLIKIKKPIAEPTLGPLNQADQNYNPFRDYEKKRTYILGSDSN